LDLYIIIEFLRVALLRFHIMLFDRRFGNFFRAEVYTDTTAFLGDAVHISYYYDVGRFKLLRIPSLLGLLKRAKIRKRLAKATTQKTTQNLGYLFG